ncbi:diacylglycerol kinase family protein [Asanoa iriomotensis]|uniref:Diacylglycerol kinase n=1 Tax=Asanoa iriomotensis TaxID=234613 RepID=A0ABQ4C349_9ACTN|nr:diacylglycerol kinase [Asanoa iriomotensis]
MLVVNPKATTTSERSRDVLIRALRSAVDLRVEFTRRRGHAVKLVREAALHGVDVVVTLGGDGTVNEAVNGLMAALPELSPLGGATPAERLPALAVVPGGSTNVFARAIGLPKDWIEGTGVILEGLRGGRFRTIGLGRADDRYFTFCAGFGLDAAVIRRVERARSRGRVSTSALYLRSTFGEYLATDRRHPAISIERPAETAVDELSTVIIQNTTPWTYLGDRPVSPNPDASFDLGLDLLGVRQLAVASATRTVTQILSSRTNPHGRHVVQLHDVHEFTLLASRPEAFQVDGDYLGEREKVRFTSVARALRVIC